MTAQDKLKVIEAAIAKGWRPHVVTLTPAWEIELSIEELYSRLQSET